ncbi:NADH-quinone oxidoreductase subunit C [Deinococcus pimensis]|uniref:NADH-quinone oxidoreductase subunit C n=1 Tax=Deinococcus pimensis TaxID=309888 RepID=UPI000483B188|nr:NADH-quinone oxidoreductase subunit C [Deinococcus pimensis]
MDPLRGRNLDVQDDRQPNPVTPAVAPAARLDALLTELGLARESTEEGLLPVAPIEPARLLQTAALLRARGFMLLDVVGIDYLDYVLRKPARFGVTYNLYQPDTNERVFLRAYVEDGQHLPSLYPVWKSANYLEREVFDLVGVRFDDHPDLRKVLTPDDLDGHPLRKDFPLGESPTLFRDGRFLDPAAFRAGLTGQQGGLTGWRGGERKGLAPRAEAPVREPKGGES